MKMSRWLSLGLMLVAVAASITALILQKPILGLDLRGGVTLLMQADFAGVTDTQTKQQDLTQIVQTIRYRVNASGLAETTVAQAGVDRVTVEIPCPAPPSPCNQPGEIRDLIERQGFLEFRKVIHVVTDPTTESPTSQEEIKQSLDGQQYLLLKAPLLTGADISDARPQTTTGLGASGRYVVQLTFTEDGAKKFVNLMTSSSPVLKGNDRLGIMLDNQIQSAPTIEPSLVADARTGGWRKLQNGTQITNMQSLSEATNLSIILRSGNLPVPVSVLSQEAIGPSIGQDSINKGLFAFVLAAGLVFLFMLVYYKLAGLIANITMILNLLMLIAVMVLLNATWTLPGIAGLILTIGMGVDSNVLIFERVREELRSGKTVRAAIDYGYERALLTIIDAHVTTLITALILFTFGSGAIKGFATTLSIGIIINLFTALIGTRLAFEFIKEREPRRLSI
ncbi:protein translocase subunit SecD [Candidatus Acetothermia bacterium]|nr:protein translocase subunit SecD [Candidatus Acetothermia bacterium]MBI3643814.1 protein translocase subunit SecD [Candidatus Acetothermia bacterium]